jgi:hypothetical protein
MLCCEQKLNFFGGPSLTTEAEARLELDQVDHEEDRIVFLANVWLDRSETFEALHTLLSGTQRMSPGLRGCVCHVQAAQAPPLCQGRQLVWMFGAAGDSATAQIHHDSSRVLPP